MVQINCLRCVVPASAARELSDNEVLWLHAGASLTVSLRSDQSVDAAMVAVRKNLNRKVQLPKSLMKVQMSSTTDLILF